MFRPVRDLGLRGVELFLLFDENFGELVAAFLGLLPVLPFAVAFLQPGGGFGGDLVAGGG